MTNQTYQQGQICGICNGFGWMYLESSEGAPTQQVVCRYCKGRGGHEVREWSDSKIRLRRCLQVLLVCATIAMLATNNVTAWNTSGSGPVGNPALVALHCVLWVLLVAAWVLLLRHRPPKGQSRHAPGFTDDRERAALGLYGAALGAKWAHDSRRRQNINRINNQGHWS
jgi:hypothetical protein